MTRFYPLPAAIPHLPAGMLALCGIALALLICAVRLCYFTDYGSALPVWDQWDGEGWNLYRPLLLGTFDFHTLIAPHNEHRIAIPRLIAAGLFQANREQWDAIPLVVVNALMAGTTYAGFALYLLRRFAAPVGLVLAVLTALCALLAHGWENLLHGFQTPFFTLLAATLAGIVWTSTARVRWHQPLVCALSSTVAVFSLGSGLLLPPVLGFVLLLRWRDQDGASRRWLAVTLALLAALTLIAFGQRAPLSLSSASFEKLLSAAAVLLSWPLPSLGVFCLLPWAFTATGLWRVIRGTDGRPGSRAMAGLACWVLLQIASMALVRGDGLTYVPSRYTDIVAFGMIANTYFALDFFIGSTATGPALRFARAVFIALGIFAVAALGTHTGVAFAAMQQRSVEFNEQRVNVSAYLVTGDPAFLRDKPMFYLPYPSPERLKEFLDDPTLRPTLHRHIFVTPAQPISAALEQDPEMGPASYAGREMLAARKHIAAVALLLLILAYAGLVWAKRENGA